MQCNTFEIYSAYYALPFATDRLLPCRWLVCNQTVESAVREMLTRIATARCLARCVAYMTAPLPHAGLGTGQLGEVVAGYNFPCRKAVCLKPLEVVIISTSFAQLRLLCSSRSMLAKQGVQGHERSAGMPSYDSRQNNSVEEGCYSWLHAVARALSVPEKPLCCFEWRLGKNITLLAQGMPEARRHMHVTLYGCTIHAQAGPAAWQQQYGQDTTCATQH
jgi:hypothetical protein